MKADVAILGLVALATAWAFWNTSSLTASKYASQPVIPRSIIQSLIEKIQAGAPWLQPINTVYVNPLNRPQGGTEYNARFMFLDTRGFFGTQYDVTATVAPDGLVNIIKQTSTSSPTAMGPFQPYQSDKYQPYSDVNASLNLQLNQALQQTRELPGTTHIDA